MRVTRDIPGSAAGFVNAQCSNEGYLYFRPLKSPCQKGLNLTNSRKMPITKSQRTQRSSVCLIARISSSFVLHYLVIVEDVLTAYWIG